MSLYLFPQSLKILKIYTLVLPIRKNINNAFINLTRNMTQLQEIYVRNHTRETARDSGQDGGRVGEHIVCHLPEPDWK